MSKITSNSTKFYIIGIYRVTEILNPNKIYLGVTEFVNFINNKSYVLAKDASKATSFKTIDEAKDCIDALDKLEYISFTPLLISLTTMNDSVHTRGADADLKLNDLEQTVFNFIKHGVNVTLYTLFEQMSSTTTSNMVMITLQRLISLEFIAKHKGVGTNSNEMYYRVNIDHH